MNECMHKPYMESVNYLGILGVGMYLYGSTCKFSGFYVPLSVFHINYCEYSAYTTDSLRLTPIKLLIHTICLTKL